jgi:serpin B
MRLGLEFRDAYQQGVLGWPGGALHSTDFRGDPEGARAKINADVEKTTRGLIKELLAQGMIHTDTAAVIVNAFYLKIAWRNAFADRQTRPALFHAPSGSRDVPTMHQQERMGYAATDGWRMVTLPTVSDVVVDVLLPDPQPHQQPAGTASPAADTGLRLVPGTLAALYDSSRQAKVDLALPRFRVQAQAVLNDPLRRLGISTAFTRDADFSGITAAEEIWIDTVVHKAVLNVDETGFEGAAATAVTMRTVSMDMDSPVPFHVDRPFLVLVRHPPTGAIYFLARVVEP